MASAREIALKILYKVDVEDTYANIAVRDALKHSILNGPDRGLVTELVYGTARTRNTIDWLLDQLLSKGIKKVTPWIRNILRLGVYQLYFLDKIPASAAVNESVKLAKKYGHPGTVKLVNGVLRNFERRKQEFVFPDLNEKPVQHISIKYSHPEWMVKRWLKEFGIKATIELCKANNRPATNSIRTNTLKISREDLMLELKKEGVSCQESSFTPEGLIIDKFNSLDELEAFKKGYFLLQDEASMVIAHLLKPQPGAFIIDACAAPGTKTTHLAQLSNDRGQILAFDIYEHKLSLIRDNCRHLGINSVRVDLKDAREIGSLYLGQVDYLLIDAPCSGLGVLRRRADARWKKSLEQIKELKKLQLEILQGACGCLKPGGSLIYSTCSISPEENIEVVREFLQSNSEFRLSSLLEYLPFSLERAEDLETAKEGYIQFLPYIHGTDGFFAARMIKEA
jgi:16S rRNA (cytosine967-C5)-methyltransferase